MLAEPTMSGTGVLGLSFAGIAGAQIFGLSVTTIFLATSFTFLGVLGRVGFEISKTADTHDGVKWSKVAALFAGGCLSAVTIAVLYLAVLKMLNIQSDSAAAIGLVFFGFSGPKAILWLLNSSALTINKRTGLNLPTLGANGVVATAPPEPPK